MSESPTESLISRRYHAIKATVLHVTAFNEGVKTDLPTILNQMEHAVRFLVGPTHTLESLTFKHGDPDAKLVAQTVDHVEVRVASITPGISDFQVYVNVGTPSWMPPRVKGVA